MSILLVLVAHDGKTLQLDVSPSTRVDAVQQALVSVTGISVSDQIVMCHGARLDPAKPLAAYKLPVADPAAAEDQPVFLYHKGYLRPGAPPPPTEPLPMLEVVVPSLPSVGLRHPLHSAHSPLIRALPDYEAQFQQQLGEARAYWEASQQRLHKCRQLMSEQEVQARAADAARANVESHYNYIAAVYTTFVDKYVAQHRHHTNLLTQFAGLSAALQSIELPQQLATPAWRVLADLQPRSKLAEWHDSCSRSHEQFAQKVSELEGVFQLLRCDVEKLFLQAPSVDLDALGAQLGEAEGLIDEQGSIVQVLSKDLLTVRQLVEDVVAQLGGSAGGASLSGAAVHDTCAAVDTMHDNHLHTLLPRVRACDSAIAEFLLRCADAKGRMCADVLEQLQGIAAQQSRIRDMKHKLAVFNEVLVRQAAAFAELQTATRLPAAYRLALAECARRAAWQEMFAGQAGRLAEHCGRITAKEAAKRDSVRRQLERYLPNELLARAGLLQDPPHCSVSVPPSDAFLLPVSPADLARLPAVIQQAADAAAIADQQAQQQRPSSLQQQQQQEGGAAGSSSASVMRLARTSSSEAAAAVAVVASTGEGAVSSASSAALPRAGSLPSASAAAAAGVAAAAGAAAGAASMMAASAWLSKPDGPPGSSAAGAAAAAGAGATGPGSNLDLALENARLRAELASLLAHAAARELSGEGGSSSSSRAVAAQGGVGASQMLSATMDHHQQQQQLASISSSISLTASAAPGQQQQQQVGAGAGAGSSTPVARPYGHGGPAVVPSSVAAPLPLVSAALQQAAAVDAEVATADAARQALTLAPVQAALAAKDELVASLEFTCRALAADVVAYEKRITELEAQMAAHFSGSSTTAAAAGLQQQQQQPIHGDVLQAVGVAPGAAAAGSSSLEAAGTQQELQLSAERVVGDDTGVTQSSGGRSPQPGPASSSTTASNTFAGGSGSSSSVAPVDAGASPSPAAAAAVVATVVGRTPSGEATVESGSAVAECAESVVAHTCQSSELHQGQSQAAAGHAAEQHKEQQANQQQQQHEQQHHQQQQQQQVEPVVQSQPSRDSAAGGGLSSAPGVTNATAELHQEQAEGEQHEPAAAAGDNQAGEVEELQQHQQGEELQQHQQGEELQQHQQGEELQQHQQGESLEQEPAGAGTAMDLSQSGSSSGGSSGSGSSGGGSGSSSSSIQQQGMPPSVAVSNAAAAAAAAAPLSVSEPDLRGVVVASPADVAAHQEQQQQLGLGGRADRSSVDGSGIPSGAAAGGISGLLTSSMNYLFHRTSSGSGGSRAEGSGSSSNASAASTTSSPPMSPPAAAAAARQVLPQRAQGSSADGSS